MTPADQGVVHAYLTGPGGTAQPADDPASLAEKLLLPLLLHEQTLLQDYGPDHPQVRSVRARIAVVREFLGSQSVVPAAVPEKNPTPPPPTSTGPRLESEPGNMVKENPSTDLVTHHDESNRGNQPTRSTSMANAEIQTDTLDLSQGVELPGFMTHLLSILAALVLVLLVQMVALLVLLRRYAGKLAPQVRLEVVQAPGSAPVETAPGTVISRRISIDDAPATSRRSADLMPESPEPLVQRSVDAGEAEPRRDAGVFRQIFEDNLRLREQLGAGHSAGN